MTIIVLNRRKIASQIPDWLEPLGKPIVLITDRIALSADFTMDSRLRYAEVIVVEDYGLDEVKAIVKDVAIRYSAERIVSCAEVDVLRAAEIRESLSIPGQTVESAVAYRDKFVMKGLLSASGINVAEMADVNTSNDLRRFAGHAGYPIALKPRMGSGSVGVCVLRDERDFLAQSQNWNEPMLAEKWVDGRFLTVDGLMHEGRVLQVWPSYTTANLDAVAGGSLLKSTMLARTDPIRTFVSAFVSQVVGILPPVSDVTAFHAEVFLRPDGSLCLCEIACRPGGCGHVPVYERAFGINLYAETLKGQAGVAFGQNMSLPLEILQRHAAGFVWFPPRRGTIVNLPDRCPISGVADFRPTAKTGQYCVGPRSVADHVAQALLQGKPDDDLIGSALAVESWWNGLGVWEQR
ncbi:ATP-grasp domain-containing protein [Xanthomonas graminis]|uniref:ATP-grasp domain-containing protein n=1 Tax=Xanthomonas graminis TaxID=3390026 RepID=UPI001F380D1F|nr:ATP-grasp domain-containing protein [Xanthomonas translucens]UKE73366.1 ATP-grasp domain-containing protein [Xanthomonas translucens pv. phleipratensis]